MLRNMLFLACLKMLQHFWHTGSFASQCHSPCDMPNRLLKEGIEELSRLSLTELQAIKGIGLVKALQIKAVFEFEKIAFGKEGA